MKHSGASRSAWRRLVALGERLLQAEGLAVQREAILETASQLLSAEADLWLDERLARLPGIDQPCLFPDQPPGPAMGQAFETRAVCSLEADGRLMVAVPLHYQDLPLGILQISRPAGQSLRTAELDLLEGLSAHISLALYITHRVAVEQWRLEQLNLVR